MVQELLEGSFCPLHSERNDDKFTHPQQGAPLTGISTCLSFVSTLLYTAPSRSSTHGSVSR